jgi:TolA-binding protein
MTRRLSARSAFVVLVLLAASPALALDEAERLWLVGERAFADGVPLLARHTLERFVQQFPQDRRVPVATLLLGRARLALGDNEAALDTFRRAQSFQPPPGQPMEPKFWEGEALFRLRRFAEARAAFDEVLRVNAASPLAADALYGIGWSDLELKDYPAAATAFRDLLSAWPESPLAPAATVHQARALVELSKFGEAAALLAPFVARYPDHALIPDARYLLGWSRLASGDVRAGLADLRAFVAAYPNREEAPAARRLITEGLARSDDRADQLEAYRALMDQRPPTAQGLAEAAAIAGRLNRTAEQDAAWRKLVTQFPEDPLAHRAALDQANAAFKRKEWKDAASLAQTAARSEDQALRAEAWLLAGESELKLKRYPAAARAFESVGALADAEPAVRYRALAGLGLAREEQREWRAALTAYEAVVARSPEPTLRDWARERVTAVKAHLGQAPPGKSAPGSGDAKKGRS